MTSQLPFPKEVIDQIKMFCAKEHPAAEKLKTFLYYRWYHERMMTDDNGNIIYPRTRCDVYYDTFFQYMKKETRFYPGGFNFVAVFAFNERIAREQRQMRRLRKLKNNSEN